MKLTGTITLALGLCLGLGLTARAAHTPVPVEGHGVWGVYQGPDTQLPQYTVDLAWGKMEFLPLETLEAHQDAPGEGYEGQIAFRWVTRGNGVQVHNQSQQSLLVSLSFTSWQEGVEGAFSQASFPLDTQQERVSLLALEGEGAGALEYAHMGEVTVTIQTL